MVFMWVSMEWIPIPIKYILYYNAFILPPRSFSHRVISFFFFLKRKIKGVHAQKLYLCVNMYKVTKRKLSPKSPFISISKLITIKYKTNSSTVPQEQRRFISSAPASIQGLKRKWEVYTSMTMLTFWNIGRFICRYKNICTGSSTGKRTLTFWPGECWDEQFLLLKTAHLCLNPHPQQYLHSVI